MKKYNPTRYSSAVGEAWMHATFKVKYCHKIFDNKLECKSIGFDSNHVHMIIDMGNYSRPEVAKMLKGYTAKKLLKKYSWLKKEYFYGSGLWSPAHYMNSVGQDMDFMEGYVMKQKYSIEGIVQFKLNQFVHATGL